MKYCFKTRLYVFTLYGRSPSEQIVPAEVQVHQRLLPRHVKRPFEAARDAVVFKDALLVPRRVALDLFGPLAHVVEMMYPYTSVIIMNTAHDIITSLQQQYYCVFLSRHSHHILYIYVIPLLTIFLSEEKPTATHPSVSALISNSTSVPMRLKLRKYSQVSASQPGLPYLQQQKRPSDDFLFWGELTPVWTIFNTDLQRSMMCMHVYFMYILCTGQRDRLQLDGMQHRVWCHNNSLFINKM